MPTARSQKPHPPRVSEENASKRRPAVAGSARKEEARQAGGRPPKFDEPSRPVTLTLPASTLEGLEQIDPDRGRAIVKLTEAALRKNRKARPPVEIVEMVPGTGLLVLGPAPSLRKIPFLHLVEVAPARYLLALDSGHDFKSLELAIHDLIEEMPVEEKSEHPLLLDLLKNIRRIRKTDRVSMAEILFVSL